MMPAWYYGTGGCRTSCPPAPAFELPDITQAKGWKGDSLSHIFKGPKTLSLISLLQHSKSGAIGVWSVDIDVRCTDAGIPLLRGNGQDTIDELGSRSWQGAADGFGLLYSATDFILTLADGDEVVIQWTEIRNASHGQSGQKACC